MRKIDWESALSDEDIAWLRTTGQPGMEERIQAHQAQYDVQVPEEEVPEDTVTRSALDPTARSSTPAVTGDGPVLIDPREAGRVDDEIADDYDSWKKPELEAEVKARNEMADTSDVEVQGTGKDGAVLKEDLVKGLRLWDQENPDALSD
jgi:hypothetical protein